MAIVAAALAQTIRVSATPARGLRAEYFEGEQPLGTPFITAIDDTASTSRLHARWYDAPPSTFSAQWFGYLAVTWPGRYTFALTSDDAAVLSVDGRVIVDNSGRHGAVRKSADVTLDRGPHAVLIDYTQYGGDYVVEWDWARDGGALNAVPTWALSPYRVPLWRVLFGRVLDLLSMGLAAVALASLIVLAWRSRGGVASHPKAASLALFVALAVLHTWPLATDPAHLTRHDNRDSMLNEWIVAWVAHQAPRDPLHLFDANIFYPEHDTLAYSEPLIPQAAMGAPLLALGASPVLTFNLLLLAGLALSGWSMCLVVHKWTGDWTAGLVAGAIFAFNAHVLTRIPHLQAQHVEFLPMALLALDSLLRAPSARRAVSVAVWSALQALTSIYLLVFTFFALTAAILTRPRDWTGARFVPFARSLAIAAATAAAILVPFLLPYYHASHDQGLTRSLADAAQYGATWMDYLSTPSRLHYPLWSHNFFVGTALFPGALGLVLAAFAVVRGDAIRDPRARMCLAIGVVGVALSFGPNMPGYATLYAVMPLLQAIRASARFGYLATLAVAVLAGFGVASLRRIASARAWRPLAVALVGVAALEPMAAPLGLTRFEGIPPIYSHIPRGPGVRVVELPFFGGAGNAQFHASYMLNSTAFWQPIVNGYSGFQPGSFYDHAAALEGFPDDRSMALIRTLGISHVFVHADQFSSEEMARTNARPELRKVDAWGGIGLYEVVR